MMNIHTKKKQHDIVMAALREARPDIAMVIDYLDEQKKPNDDKVRTFEDCARVEKEICEHIYSIFR